MYTPADAITYLVDPDSLSDMLRACQTPGARVALIGFNEYSKNLINLAGGCIVAVYESEPWKLGIHFRGIPVVALSEQLDINKVICCDYAYLQEESAAILSLYPNGIDYYYPPRIAYKPTELLDTKHQERMYRSILAEAESAPCSMMSSEKVLLLIELMKQGLRNPGAIVEMGVWQGGSSWYMAKALSYMEHSRPLYMIDLFESHMMDRTATMCNDQIARQMAFYPPAQQLMGLVDDENILGNLRSKPICFAHYDLGFIPVALNFLWEHLQPGSPLLLDNYGHIAGRPWLYDRFFADRDRTIVRLPWSEQGIVHK